MEKLKGTIFESPIMAGLALGDNRYTIGDNCKKCRSRIRLTNGNQCVSCKRRINEEYRRL